VYISYVLFGGQHYCVALLCFSVKRGPGNTCISSESCYFESCPLVGSKAVIKIMIKVLMLSGPPVHADLKIENYFVTNAQVGQC